MLKQRFVKPKIDKFIQLYSRNAKLEQVNSTGVVTDLILTEKGYWYLYPPDITFTGGGGSGASAVAIVDNEYNLDFKEIKQIPLIPVQWLNFDENGIAVCPESDEKYELVENKVRKI